MLGIEISKVAQPKRQQSFQIVGNDIVFPIDQMFPPSHVHVHLQDVDISGSEFNLVFDSGKQHDGDRQSAAENPPTTAASYTYFHGGTMKFALLTMSPVDLELVPLKPDGEKSFEFSVDDYYRQLVGGYSKSLGNKGLLVYMADESEIHPSTQPAQKQSK